MVAFRQFIGNQSGSVSLWNLFWLTSFLVILGLAVDVSLAMHTKSRLQHVAESSAHAGALEISPSPTNSVITAVRYSVMNVPQYQNVVNDGDVVVGWWDFDKGTFDTNNPSKVNAVQVISTRDTGRDNAPKTAFLSIIGFNAWDVGALAIAAPLRITDIPCRANGLFAGGRMEQTSNNTIASPFCMYGDTSFKIGQNNMIECGVVLMTPTPGNFQNGTPPTPPGDGSCDDNYAGVSKDQMVAQSFQYGRLPVVAEAEYRKVKEILQAYVDGEPINDIFDVIPPWMNSVSSISASEFNKRAKAGTLAQGTLYNVSCGGGGKALELTGIVRNVGVFTDCEIRVAKDKDVSAQKPTKTETGTKALCDPDDSACSTTDWLAEISEDRWSCSAAIAGGFESYLTALDGTYRDGSTDVLAERCGIEPGANGLWDNVLIFTSNKEGGNVEQKAVTFPNNMQLGRIDGCTEGGGVRIYSAGSVDTPSGTTAHGLQIVTLGSVQFAAKANGAWGINIQAMNDIKYTANGAMGGCDIDPDAGASEVVITARPVTIVR